MDLPQPPAPGNPPAKLAHPARTEGVWRVLRPPHPARGRAGHGPDRHKEVTHVLEILAGFGVAYCIAILYHRGRQEGANAGWASAWRRAREKFQRSNRRGNGGG